MCNRQLRQAHSTHALAGRPRVLGALPFGQLYITPALQSTRCARLRVQRGTPLAAPHAMVARPGQWWICYPKGILHCRAVCSRPAAGMHSCGPVRAGTRRFSAEQVCRAVAGPLPGTLFASRPINLAEGHRQYHSGRRLRVARPAALGAPPPLGGVAGARLRHGAAGLPGCCRVARGALRAWGDSADAMSLPLRFCECADSAHWSECSERRHCLRLPSCTW